MTPAVILTVDLLRVVNLLTSTINSDLSVNKIDYCHRIGKRNSTKSRPVIIKFLSFKDRDMVFKNKKKLKGTQYIVKEDLTKVRLEVFNEAATKFGFRNVWSSGGAVFVSTADGVKRVVSHDELKSLTIR